MEVFLKQCDARLRIRRPFNARIIVQSQAAWPETMEFQARNGAIPVASDYLDSFRRHELSYLRSHSVARRGISRKLQQHERRRGDNGDGKRVGANGRGYVFCALLFCSIDDF